MRILVACEESQVVTRAFREKGHEAFSCDIEPCSGYRPQWHIQGDVTPLLQEAWDMILAFPPCTNLATSGSAWFKEKIADGSQQKSIDFFMLFANHACGRIAIENPVGIMSNEWRRPDQIIEPYWFGHLQKKATCLWLKGLPPLKPTNYVYEEMMKWPKSRWNGFVDALAKANRAKIRSKTFTGVAKAMASQWG